MGNHKFGFDYCQYNVYLNCCPCFEGNYINFFSFIFYYVLQNSLIIHEENTKEITTVAEVLNRQEICVDLHKL